MILKFENYNQVSGNYWCAEITRKQWDYSDYYNLSHKKFKLILCWPPRLHFKQKANEKLLSSLNSGSTLLESNQNRLEESSLLIINKSVHFLKKEAILDFHLLSNYEKNNKKYSKKH